MRLVIRPSGRVAVINDPLSNCNSRILPARWRRTYRWDWDRLQTCGIDTFMPTRATRARQAISSLNPIRTSRCLVRPPFDPIRLFPNRIDPRIGRMIHAGGRCGEARLDPLCGALRSATGSGYAANSDGDRSCGRGLTRLQSLPFVSETNDCGIGLESFWVRLLPVPFLCNDFG